ncbi:biotin--[acetyl-CoA-carboxylase] ligase [Flavobacterium sp.]
MHIIKLSATDSTNDYLKQLHKEKSLDNYTIITTLSQTKGKGQMGTQWQSEIGKNLTFSILVKNISSNHATIFDYNVAVAVSIFEVLQALQIPNLNIKWPNDILAENKKIGGILIENSVKADGTIDSIIGIGLNVNQEDFSKLIVASSLKNVAHRTFDLDELLVKIVHQLQQNLSQLTTQAEVFWKTYTTHLFKLNVPMVFEDQIQNRFMGIIKGVTPEGKLMVILEDDSMQHFSLKEVRLLY